MDELTPDGELSLPCSIPIPARWWPSPDWEEGDLVYYGAVELTCAGARVVGLSLDPALGTAFPVRPEDGTHQPGWPR